MRIGILFGGKSREREISFAGGRTVYDLLDKSLFTPVPIFIDSLGRFILLDWQYLYKGSIRDFYPPVNLQNKYGNGFQVYAESLQLSDVEWAENIIDVGREVLPSQFKELFDFGFLALHGPYGEDGSIQGLLEFYDIPYSGSGILPSAIGIDKTVQKHLWNEMGVLAARSKTIERSEWEHSLEYQEELFQTAKALFDLPLVIKSGTQGSSIGVSIIKEWSFEPFQEAINRSFFIHKLKASDWNGLTAEEKRSFIQEMTDVYANIGFPLMVEDTVYDHPRQLLESLDSIFTKGVNEVLLKSLKSEPVILIEEFIEGKEFSCIVIEDEQSKPLALPPTEIIKSSAIFDYRAKYLPGISRKVTPIDVSDQQVKAIAAACENLYELFRFDVYARIDGIIRPDGAIYLNDPNTTSGMLPSAFFFHQAAEIGLSPTQFLTYIVHKSLEKRQKSSHKTYSIQNLLRSFNQELNREKDSAINKKRVAVVLGGISTERHISVESGRNVYEKLASSGKYQAFPVFLTQEDDGLGFFVLPMNLLLKDNADDIRDKVEHFQTYPVIQEIINKAAAITGKFASKDYRFQPEKITIDELKERCDAVFIGLHGRPGEDGTLQKLLQGKEIPYNGSSPESASVTIDKFLTNEILRTNGFQIPEHILVNKSEWESQKHSVVAEIERRLSYPFIAKPSDDGCSSAVKKIKSRDELELFAEAMFRPDLEMRPSLRQQLELQPNEEFPCKTFFVVEEIVSQKDAPHFLEITGGMITHLEADGSLAYEVFEPSEALAQKGILSLEEKFLAGEGQNITPARFAASASDNDKISAYVRKELERAARVLKVDGYCRIDAFVRIYSPEKVEVIFIEVNSLPGLTPATCIFHQAAINGYKPFEFLDQIITYGIQKENISADGSTR